MNARQQMPSVVLYLMLTSLLAFPGQDLTAQTATARDSLLAAARAVMDAAHYCALVTVDAVGVPQARTMDPFPPEDDMTVWLGTNRRTRKVEQIGANPQVTLYYQAPDGSGYVTILGRARLVDDQGEKASRWKPEWEAFYPDRARDYLLIEVVPERLEVVDYSRGIVTVSESWTPPSVVFPADEAELQRQMEQP